MSEHELVLTHIEDGVGIISLNRPEKHNALHNAFSDAIEDAIEHVYAQPDARVILLRGEGKSFCSGRDLTHMGETKHSADRTTFELLARHEKRQATIMGSRKPSICAMKGYSVGAGFELALTCDMRVAGESSQMWLPEIRMGLLPDVGGAHILSAIAGPSRAKYITMTGDRVVAQRALEWGIVDFVVPDAEVDDFALDLARRIAAMPPIAVGFAKNLCDDLHGPELKRGVQAEIAAQLVMFGTEDFQEGMAAMKEKRTPHFKGR